MIDPQQPAQGKARRGRRPGSTIATFATLQDLTVQDFAFVRGIVGGMNPEQSFKRFYANRYFDAEGKVVVHGHHVAAHAENLTRRIGEAARSLADAESRAAAALLLAEQAPSDQQEQVKERAHLNFETWAASMPDGMYGENELVERYEEYLAEQDGDSAAQERTVIRESHSAARRVQALNHLQSVLAVRPREEQPVSTWFAPALASTFAAMKLPTMGHLVRWIAARGPRWHMDVKGLGPKRAERVLGWLREAAKTSPSDTAGLDRIDGPAWIPIRDAVLPAASRPTGGASALPALAARRSDLAPLEVLQVPDRISGENGAFRNPKGSVWNAHTDLEAIQRWLSLFQAAGRARTHEAYQREIERFYLWCIRERQKALSSIDTADAVAYQQFLADIPWQWKAARRRVPRGHPLWRPFRGQLDQRSQTYALGVVRHFFDAALRSGYLTANPFNDVKVHASTRQVRRLDATRSLSDDDLQVVIEHLARLRQTAAASPDPVMRALARRAELAVQLVLTTGMRLAEVVTASLADTDRREVDGQLALMLNVLGKGSRHRWVTLNDEVQDLLAQHHADWRQIVGTGRPALLAAFEARPPLVAALHARPGDGRGKTAVSEATELAYANGALSSDGLYRTLKTFFRQAGESAGPERAARFAAMSTHWLRHTFAHHALRTSPGDQGLKAAQQLLGHRDISTTAEYLKQDTADLVRAARRVNPLALVMANKLDG